MYYNYVYLDPRKPGKFEYKDICFLFEPLYVGKGSNNRAFSHLLNTSRISNKIFRNKLNYLRKFYSNEKLENYIIQFNFTDNEDASYFNETSLITEIGSKFINEIKDGPLLNICLKNIPPSLKGKTYQEIYGDKYIEEIEKRRKIQIEKGGYFTGYKHTKNTLVKISKASSGKNNPMYGKKHTKETLEKISTKNKGKNGAKNPNARKHKIISPDGKEFIINGEIEKFCIENNISYSTLFKAMKDNRDILYGKTKGWKLYYYD